VVKTTFCYTEVKYIKNIKNIENIKTITIFLLFSIFGHLERPVRAVATFPKICY